MSTKNTITANAVRTSFVQARGLILALVVTAISLVTSSVSFALTIDEAFMQLESISKHSSNPIAAKAYDNAAGWLSGHGPALTAKDIEVLNKDLVAFSKDPKKAGGAEAIRMALGKKGPQVVKETAVSKHTTEVIDNATVASVLELDTPPALTVSAAQKARALSIVQEQVSHEGTDLGIHNSGNGTDEKQKSDAEKLLAAANAGATSLKGGPVDGDTLGFASILLSSAKRAEDDATKLVGESRKIALRVAAAYKVAAASLGGTLKVEG